VNRGGGKEDSKSVTSTGRMGASDCVTSHLFPKTGGLRRSALPQSKIKGYRRKGAKQKLMSWQTEESFVFVGLPKSGWPEATKGGVENK